MGAYQRGTEINLVNRFWTVDPLTKAGTLADPTVVTFTVLDPEGTETVYVFPGATNIAHPATGIFVCTLTPPLPTGTYRYLCEGTGAVVASSEDFFDILPSGVLAPSGPNVAVPGPCSTWINGDDVAAGGFDVSSGVGVDHFLLDDVAYDASAMLYELSGRQFPGICTRTVRPCVDSCRCFGWSRSLGLGLYAWWSWGIAPAGLLPNAWGWFNEAGDLMAGCGASSYVQLAGYPVREILQVKIDGVVMPLNDSNGNPNYRLDLRRRLTRMDDPSTDPALTRLWPLCQDMSLDDTHKGTFSVTYTWGSEVPNLGRQAAAQLARELWNAENNSAACKLPTKVTRIVRQGITMERIVPLADMLRSGSTGLQIVDAFIATYNPTKMRRRPAIFSPDLQKYARDVGQG